MIDLNIQTIQQMQGIPAFLSPENLTAQDNSPAGDVYAFGGVLVELFSEIPIWEGLNYPLSDHN
ncbi:MAG: hypothetical protein MJE68_09155 [Proteobacteria bacterium]|nr:hypothetical protein [Pseudomonadota bacterium]